MGRSLTGTGLAPSWRALFMNMMPSATMATASAAVTAVAMGAATAGMAATGSGRACNCREVIAHDRDLTRPLQLLAQLLDLRLARGMVGDG